MFELVSRSTLALAILAFSRSFILGFWYQRRLAIRWHLILNWLGLAAAFTLIIYIWVILERPPFKTLGETRLWYGTLLPLIGLALRRRLTMTWPLQYCQAMAIVFLVIDLLRPAAFDSVLAPALQSPWFVPHVVVYMVAYALLGAATVMALRLLGKRSATELYVLDTLVRAGTSFLALGLLFGAVWAKEAWGHYWSWDPKETWALITWLMYIIYIHGRYFLPNKEKLALNFLIVSFIFLLLCWFGVNYFAKGSVHAYS